ncbi:hypothetical protein TNCV_3025621 [Trichonephila clavipes]|nr:hypothetical protein TNCV_3025621 [Trichonephila clavipes]
MRPLEDAGKNWLKMAAFSTMMVAVDLRPQQIGRRKEENREILIESIVFRDEHHLQLCPDDHRRLFWRRPGQRADPAFTIARDKGR